MYLTQRYHGFPHVTVIAKPVHNMKKQRQEKKKCPVG